MSFMVVLIAIINQTSKVDIMPTQVDPNTVWMMKLIYHPLWQT